MPAKMRQARLKAMRLPVKVNTPPGRVDSLKYTFTERREADFKISLIRVKVIPE